MNAFGPTLVLVVSYVLFYWGLPMLGLSTTPTPAIGQRPLKPYWRSVVEVSMILHLASVLSMVLLFVTGVFR